MTDEDKNTFIEQMVKAIEDFNRKQAEYEHQQIIKMCLENDFIVPTAEVKEQLEKVLPKETQIFVSNFTSDVLMVKKCVLNPCHVEPLKFEYEGER